MVWLPDGKEIYSSILYHFFSYFTLNNIATLKSGLEVTQAHSLCPEMTVSAVKC